MSLNRAKHNDRDLIIKGKDFRDKIHGNVKLQDVIARLVDTPEFQRLAGLKQLGASAYVYRGAVHTRFEHSVGVAHLAEKLCLVLKEHQPELGISDRDVMCVKIAGLCHDLGHGPFSHCWDGLFMRRFGLSWRHEDGSVAMLRHLLAANGIDLFADYGLDATDLLFVEEQILGTAPEKRRGRPDKEYLYEIVNNVWSGLDVDKLDYLQRDASDAGIAGDKIDSDRCIGLARVAWADDGRGGRRRTIAYPEKMVFEVLDVFSMRYRLHRKLYQHRATKQIELMLVDALMAADKRPMMLGSTNAGHPDGLWRLSECVNDMAAFTNLKDSVVDIILNSPDPALDRSKSILRRMLRRQLYVCVGRADYDARAAGKEEAQIAREILAAGRWKRRRQALAVCCEGDDSESDGGGRNSCGDDGGDGDGGDGGDGDGGMFRGGMFAEDAETEKDTDDESGGEERAGNRARADGGRGSGSSAANRRGNSTANSGGNSSCRGGSGGGGAASNGIDEGALEFEDIIVELMHLHHGQKDRNPVDSMRFFGKFAASDNTEARQLPREAYAAALPACFEWRCVRVFCREPLKADAAREAFDAWCERTPDCGVPLSQS